MNTIRRNTLNSLITPIAMDERTARLARDTNKARTFAWGIRVFKIAFNQNDTEVGAVSEVVAILARNAHIKSWDADAIESMQFTADYALILARAVENAANQKVAA